MGNETMAAANFARLVDSYADDFLDMGGEVASAMAEKTVRGAAKRFGGCISCVFSRKRQAVRSYESEGPLVRTCVLGLAQDSCESHMEFPAK